MVGRCAGSPAFWRVRPFIILCVVLHSWSNEGSIRGPSPCLGVAAASVGNETLTTRRLVALSSSKLESCVNDGSEDLDCEMRMVLTVTLEHGQDATESAQFMVRDAADERSDKQQLLKPWRITWKKSKAFWRYPIRYLQDVNNKPVEITFRVGWNQCKDNPRLNEEQLTCGVAKMGDERVPDSEGFCCGCDANDIFSNLHTRGHLDCNVFKLQESGHCMALDPLWYSIFEVEPPQVFYDITVELAKPDDPNAPWQNVSYQTVKRRLSHRRPVAEAEGGAVRLQLVGDLATARAPWSLESRYLAIPHKPDTHPRVNQEYPLKNAMLVDKAAFDLSGLTCNKIGVSYTAFKKQNDKCEGNMQDCLASQLQHLHEQDIEHEAKGYPPRNFVRGFCDGAAELGYTGRGSNAVVHLACPMKQRHTTLMRLEVKAEKAMFVTNVATGKIVSAVAPSFEMLSGGGEVDITVISTGRVAAQFVIGIPNCSTGFDAGPAVSLSLKPYESRSQQIRLISSQMEGGDGYECHVTLSNSLGATIDTKVVQFNTSDTAVTQGAQAGIVNRGEGDEIFGKHASGGDCTDMCPGALDVLCMVIHHCWGRLGGVLFIIGLSVGGLIVCIKFGLPCKICAWICASTSRKGRE